MADLAILTPTRGRPKQFAEMVEAVQANSELHVRIWAAVDDDETADYLEPLYGKPYDVLGVRGERLSLSRWTNVLAQRALEVPNPPKYLASLGDDHRPRTKGWDRELVSAIEALGVPGFAYGNDLLQGINLCSAWVVSAEIVRKLGWMMLPDCQHMYVDNAVMELGRATGRIVYRPGVVIEHLHPVAGKAVMDDSYRESNSPERYESDRIAFEAWRRDGLASDADLIRSLV